MVVVLWSTLILVVGLNFPQVVSGIDLDLESLDLWPRLTSMDYSVNQPFKSTNYRKFSIFNLLHVFLFIVIPYFSVVCVLIVRF